MSFKRKSKNGGLDLLVKRPKVKGTVEVGIIDAGAHDESGQLTVAEIGYINEFGTKDGRIKPRSFIRSTVVDKKDDIIDLQTKLVRQMNQGLTSEEEALGLLGDFMRGAISQKISDLKKPENAPSTIRLKQSSNPLIDTGQLLNSITYKVNV